MTETAPIAITSAPVPVTAGQLVRIHGFARVSEPIRSSRDGLRIFDSLGGEDLAQRIQKTNGWYEFTLYRGAPRDGTITLTCALSGIGEAWLDDVTIQLLGQLPSQARLPTRLSPLNSADRLPH